MLGWVGLVETLLNFKERGETSFCFPYGKFVTVKWNAIHFHNLRNEMWISKIVYFDVFCSVLDSPTFFVSTWDSGSPRYLIVFQSAMSICIYEYFFWLSSSRLVHTLTVNTCRPANWFSLISTSYTICANAGLWRFAGKILISTRVKLV